MTSAPGGLTVVSMAPTLRRGRVARPAGMLTAALLLLAFALAGDPPRASAASCSGSIQPSGAFGFTCDTQLGTTGGPSTSRFILWGVPDIGTLTSVTVFAPAGVTCGPLGFVDQICQSAATIPAGTTVTGSAVAAEGEFCFRAAEPSIGGFFAGTSGATEAGLLMCPDTPPGTKGGAPKWKKKCKKIRDKQRRRACIQKHKQGR